MTRTERLCSLASAALALLLVGAYVHLFAERGLAYPLLVFEAAIFCLIPVVLWVSWLAPTRERPWGRRLYISSVALMWLFMVVAQSHEIHQLRNAVAELSAPGHRGLFDDLIPKQR